MSYLVLKLLHILSAMVFLGTGLGLAWIKLRADRSGDPRIIAWGQGEIVLGDLIFTIPSAVLLPATGALLVAKGDWPWTGGWVLWGLIAYGVAGACWVPAALLQLRMRRLAQESLERGTPLPPAWHRANRWWFVLGLPAFTATILALWHMVSKGAG